MLSLFPSLFDYSVVAVGVLRVVVALIFIIEGYKNLPKKGTATTFRKKFMPIVLLIGGIFLLAGLSTQAVAVVLGAVSLKKAFREYKKTADENKRISFFLLLFIVSLSFLFLGPGLWSIDYPL